jgi:hypothetical protein
MSGGESLRPLELKNDGTLALRVGLSHLTFHVRNWWSGFV